MARSYRSRALSYRADRVAGYGGLVRALARSAALSRMALVIRGAATSNAATSSSSRPPSRGNRFRPRPIGGPFFLLRFLLTIGMIRLRTGQIVARAEVTRVNPMWPEPGKKKPRSRRCRTGLSPPDLSAVAPERCNDNRQVDDDDEDGQPGEHPPDDHRRQ